MRLTKFQNFILKLIGVELPVYSLDEMGKQFDQGYEQGKRQAKIEFAVLPLPFTHDQLLGREYGTFITPAGFGTAFGECNIPAPSPHGYEQRAYYCGKDALNNGDTDLRCHGFAKFDNPADNDTLVPVIVTLLR